MAAIVATLAYFPSALAAALGLGLAGVPFETLATFGGLLGLYGGLFAWWLIFFTGALIYVACLFPWGDNVLAWPRKK